MTDNFLKGCSDQVGKAAVCRSNLAIECHGNEHVVERVDQIAVTLLRALDYGKELIELAIAWRIRGALLDTAHQPPQLGHLLVTLPCINNDGGDDDDQCRKQELKAPRERANGLPGSRDVCQRKQTEQKVSQPPQVPLALFELGQTVGDDGPRRLVGTSDLHAVR